MHATQIRQKDGIFYFVSYKAKDLLAKVRFISRFYGEGEQIAASRVSQDDDIAHGFGILWSNCNMQIEPGETKTMHWKAEKAGVVPFYCSNFCSALHQEMQGYIEVRPKGSAVSSLQRPSQKALDAMAALEGK